MRLCLLKKLLICGATLVMQLLRLFHERAFTSIYRRRSRALLKR